MDEIINVEACIGEVIGVIGLQFLYQHEEVQEEHVEYEQFPEKVVEVKPVVAVPEGGEGDVAPVEDPPAEEEGEKKAPVWSAEDYKWTVSNRQQINMPRLFMTMKHKRAYDANFKISKKGVAQA
jgi:hypothetical protein